MNKHVHTATLSIDSGLKSEGANRLYHEKVRKGGVFKAVYLPFLELFNLCKELNRMLLPALGGGPAIYKPLASAALSLPCVGQENSEPCRALCHLSHGWSAFFSNCAIANKSLHLYCSFVHHHRCISHADGTENSLWFPVHVIGLDLMIWSLVCQKCTNVQYPPMGFTSNFSFRCSEGNRKVLRGGVDWRGWSHNSCKLKQEQFTCPLSFFLFSHSHNFGFRHAKPNRHMWGLWWIVLDTNEFKLNKSVGLFSKDAECGGGMLVFLFIFLTTSFLLWKRSRQRKCIALNNKSEVSEGFCERFLSSSDKGFSVNAVLQAQRGRIGPDQCEMWALHWLCSSNNKKTKKATVGHELKSKDVGWKPKISQCCSDQLTRF